MVDLFIVDARAFAISIRPLGLRTLYINAPAMADSVDIKSFSQYSNLSPRIPIGRYQYLIPIDNIVLQSLSL